MIEDWNLFENYLELELIMLDFLVGSVNSDEEYFMILFLVKSLLEIFEFYSLHDWIMQHFVIGRISNADSNASHVCCPWFID